MPEKVNLQSGFRVEVEALIMPRGQFGARLYGRHPLPSGKYRWKQHGPIVVADTPEDAARNLMTAMNEGLLKGVEVSG